MASSTTSQGTVSLEDARRVTAAGEDRAHEIEQPQNIAVVDAGGNLVSHVRMDGAWIGSVDIAINKAFTARAFDLPTADLAANSQPGGQFYGIPGVRRAARSTTRSGSPVAGVDLQELAELLASGVVAVPLLADVEEALGVGDDRGVGVVAGPEAERAGRLALAGAQAAEVPALQQAAGVGEVHGVAHEGDRVLDRARGCRAGWPAARRPTSAW